MIYSYVLDNEWRLLRNTQEIQSFTNDISVFLERR
jgi:hypothetical protein